MQLRQEPVFVRRRRLAALIVIGLLIALAVAGSAVFSVVLNDQPAAAKGDSGRPAPAASAAPSTSSASPSASSSAPSASTPAPSASGGPADEPSASPSTSPAADGHRSDRTVLQRVDRITGAITPKSVVSSQHGVVIANNMMYSHTVTAYDAKTRKLLATIPDSVQLSKFGVKGHPGTSQGAPVEGAFTKDGRYAYVSNYSMYGAGFGPHGLDVCSPQDGYDASYLYRIDTETMSVDQVIKVGAVPKYVAITPDQSKVLVTNWCDYTLSIVDRAKGKEVATVGIGPMPRGIAIAPDGRTAYVTAMWTDHVYKVDLTDPPKQAPIFASPGDRMRHLDISPDGRWLYGVSTGDNAVFKINAKTGKIVDRAATGAEPRSMAISPDGRALYVVNYNEATMSKIRTSDMTPLGKVATDIHPIGVTYVPATNSVWVACYGGSIIVFDDDTLAHGKGSAKGT